MLNTKVSTSSMRNRVKERTRGLSKGSPPNNGTAWCRVQGVIGLQTGNGVPVRPVER